MTQPRRRRQVREKQARGRSMVGERFTAEVGPIAHGGHCIVRVPTGGSSPVETAAGGSSPVETAAGGSSPVETRVVFTRHCLPGETVVLEITEGTEGDRFWRGDAVEILSPSPDRVAPPCPYAGPSLCGGCDFQHVAVPRQRLLKADVVREQLTRLGGLAADDPLVRDLVVEAVPTRSVEPSRDDGLHWRTRMQYVDLPDGGRGMRAHRSQHVVPIDECLIAHPSADERRHGVVTETVGDREFRVEADGFWQVHPGAPGTLVGTVLEVLAPRPGEKVLDLYAGVGLFAAFLADRVGESGRVVAVEGDRTACAHAQENLRALRQARVEPGSVERVLVTAYDEPFDLVVLDPPREGAKRAVVEEVGDRAPRAVAYVACDPAALARDVRSFAELGYRLTALRAFDLFPMTSHVECVALLTRTGSDLR